ncbi:MAG: helix-turn-helix domain-containing protein [Erythrobacter sp.]
MPRHKTYTKASLVEAAMHEFWRNGYEATSMDDLVRASGVSRHGIYSDVGGKRELFLAGFETYKETIVSPALNAIAIEGSGLAGIRRYFEIQIALAESGGLPGPGCLVANAMTETAPHDNDVAAEVQAHNELLTASFLQAITRHAPSLPKSERIAISSFLTMVAQGLWSMSRTIEKASTLRAQASTLISILEERLSQ